MNTLFISCVSSEFGIYRDALRKDFDGPNLHTKIQENFHVNGGPTMENLDEYIQHCDGVIHICGDMTGSIANQISVEFITTQYPDFAKRFPVLQPVMDGNVELSYTQWEAYLAIYHGKRLYIAKPVESAPRSSQYIKDYAQIELQTNHLQCLNQIGYYAEIEFKSEDELAKNLYKSKLGELINSIPRIKPINLPYLSIGKNFKGREGFIKDLRTAFDGLKTGVTAIGIHGLGGVGKTRLAVEYALQYKHDYTALLFINADNPDSFQTNLANLAVAMDLPEKEAKEEGVKYAAVVKWLNTYKCWVLILDNVDTLEATEKIEEFLAELQHGHALITTRISNWSGSVETILLDTLSKEAAIAFLLESTEKGRMKKANDGEMAGLLAKELGYLALALEQARAYILSKEISLEAYLASWQNKQKEVMQWFNGRLMNYHSSVAITWQTSFDQLSTNAKTLLNRLAWFAPDPIPKTILETDVLELPPMDMLSAWAELKGLSLCSSTADKTAFTVHRLVQEVTRNWMDEQTAETSLKEALLWIDAAFVGEPQDVRDWPVLEPLAAHVQLFAVIADKKGIGGPTNRLFNQLGRFFLIKAQHSEAEPLMRRALEIDEASYGDNHPNVAGDLNNLAQLLKATNRLQDAEPLMRRALVIHQVSYGDNHPLVALSLNNLALLLNDTNRLAEAEPFFRKALEIHQLSYGDNHPSVAASLNNQAHFLMNTNRLAEAEPLMRKALEIHQLNYGDNHPSVALSLNNLAQLLKDTNRLTEAEPLMRKALELEKASFGEYHPNVAITLGNLAQLLEATNRQVEAEPLFRKALEINQESYGDNHPSVALSLNNLALLLKDSNRLAEAEPMFRKALEIDQVSFGDNHPVVAKVLHNLAQLLKATNRLVEAEPLMRRALEINQLGYGDVHPEVAIDLNDLAQLLKAMNNLTEAEPMMRRALEIDKSTFGMDHLEVAFDLYNLAELLRAMKRFEEAELLMRKAYVIVFKNLGGDHPKTQIIKLGYNFVLQEMGNSEAEIEAIIQELCA